MGNTSSNLVKSTKVCFGVAVAYIVKRFPVKEQKRMQVSTVTPKQIWSYRLVWSRTLDSQSNNDGSQPSNFTM